MARTTKFHLAENCDPRIAVGLRLHGIDVSTTAEAGLLRTPDETQLAYAVANNRVVVTQDTDFLRLAAAGHEHRGIVFFATQTRSIGQVIRALQLIWEVYEEGEMRKGRVHLSTAPRYHDLECAGIQRTDRLAARRVP
jgi:predicted nuclease of predicted toxin-antitoxin system